MAERPGEVLKQQALKLLSARYGQVKEEFRAGGKRADLFFIHPHCGRPERVYVECKDYEGPLKRHQIEQIWGAYHGIVRKNAPALLLVVTRHGLTPDAEAFFDEEHFELRHETIWDLENTILGLGDYTASLSGIFDEDGLSRYYIEAKASELQYAPSSNELDAELHCESIFERIQDWIEGENARPIAILGGYGAGKSSLAKRIIAAQASRCEDDSTARKPILIKLGVFTSHSRLEGILGAMFTYDFPVPSFNTHRFLELNEQGRLLIVLDGFDEMKHAMTFGDFRAQLLELNKLVRGKSRVILLGRPNAFLSIDERAYVLRGRARLSDGEYFQTPGWPEFQEYRLNDFSPPERYDFVVNYLLYLTGAVEGTPEHAWAVARAEDVNRVAETDPPVFGKPVHAKILTDLASDPLVDIEALGNSVGRWKLYQVFFQSLVHKEVEKDARRAIGEDARLTFLRTLAFWLWTERSGHTAFSAFDVPSTLLQGLPEGESTDPDSKLREYLTGAFLEEKYGQTYFFHHRSFAEFLVADYMYNNPPSGDDHTIYASLVKEGVEEFLLEAPDKKRVTSWVANLSECTGPIPLHYLEALSRMAGNAKQLALECPRGEAWEQFFQCFDGPVRLSSLNLEATLVTARDGDVTECLMAAVLLLARMLAKEVDEIIPDLEELFAAIFEKLFRGATTNIMHDQLVQGASRFLGDALSNGAKRAAGFQPNMRETWGLEIDFDALVLSMEGTLRKQGVSIQFEGTRIAGRRPIVVGALNVVRRMRSNARDMFLEFIERNSRFDDLCYTDDRRRRR